MTALMVLLLGWQVFMPAVNNGHYQIMFEPASGSIIRIDTQDGSMQRCDKEFKCFPIEVKKEEPKDDKSISGS